MINPVLKKELKQKMRTWKTPFLISFYCLVLMGFLGIMFLSIMEGIRYNSGINPQIIMTMFIGMVIFQFGVLMFIIPATTAGSITSEKQRRTFDLLLCTKMRPISIILGKLSASLITVIMLIFISMPFFSVISMFGSISIWNLLILFAYLVFVAIFIGTLGILNSTIFKKTLTSLIVTYLQVIAIVFGTFILAGVGKIIESVYDTDIFYIWFSKLLYINPFIGLNALQMKFMGQNTDVNKMLLDYASKNPLYPFWINIGILVALIALMMFFAVRKIDPIRSKK